MPPRASSGDIIGESPALMQQLRSSSRVAQAQAAATLRSLAPTSPPAARTL